MFVSIVRKLGENQKGVNAPQRYSVENPKGVLVLSGTSLGSVSALLALNTNVIDTCHGNPYDLFN